jgi:predicted transglutaminase-like cysteine proteinase
MGMALGGARALGFILAAVFMLSSAVLVAPAEARKYPKIFGSIELFSKKMDRFPQWTGMLGRFGGGAKTCETATCTAKGWQNFIETLKGKDLKAQLKEVNKTMNSKRYILDMDNWGKDDYWATPYQFLKKNGDCEDYAISKYMILKELGVPAENMRVVALQDLNLKLGHAVLVVYDGDEPMLLDNQISSVVAANSVRHYQPVFSINEEGWWLHRR